MATERLAMHHLGEFLRQKLMLKRSHRDVVRRLAVSMGVISGVVTAPPRSAWTGRRSRRWTTRRFEVRLYGPRTTREARPLPDPAEMHMELRKPGRDAAAAAPRVPGAAPRRLSATRSSATPTTVAGAKRSADDAPGARRRRQAVRRLLGQEAAARRRRRRARSIEVELFVAVLGASNYTYAEATRTQTVAGLDRQPRARARLLRRRAGAIVPDQLKSGVTKSLPLRARRAADVRRARRGTTARRSCRRDQVAARQGPSLRPSNPLARSGGSRGRAPCRSVSR